MARPSAPAEALESAADELGRFARYSRDLADDEREQYERSVARVLQETAEIARHVSGALPWAWTHYLSARRAFRSDAELAGALGVSRSRVTRWKQGETPDPENAARLRDLDIVVSLLSGFLEAEAIPDWLRGSNPHLGDSRPLELLYAGRLSEVVRAIEAEKSGAFA
ncbi:MAG: DUF2384 domain-containing protein [Gemmatimonadetes bacterium]|nr:DUF2384 domain-containing protein [Gemmatimonadota bacterium]